MIIDYYFSVLSDWAYFGGERFERLARRYGATVCYKPIRLSEIYERTGGILLQKRSTQRQDYRVVELERWSKYLGIPISLFPKHYPTDDSLASCAIIAAAKLNLAAGDLANGLLKAIWVQEQNISDSDTVLDVANGLGMNGSELVRLAGSQETQSEWQSNTDQAVSSGVFGSPFYICNGHIFWGQDRLPFLEDVLRTGSAGRIDMGRPIEAHAA